MKELSATESDFALADNGVSKGLLIKYLGAKYGFAPDEITVSENDPETTFMALEGSEIKARDHLLYTGYYVAKVQVNNQYFDVKYRVSRSEGRTPSIYDGADNYQTADLQKDIEGYLQKSFKDCKAVRVLAGEFKPESDWLLDGFYDGKDFFAPIPHNAAITISLSFTDLSEDIGKLMQSRLPILFPEEAVGDTVLVVEAQSYPSSVDIKSQKPFSSIMGGKDEATQRFVWIYPPVNK